MTDILPLPNPRELALIPADMLHRLARSTQDQAKALQREAARAQATADQYRKEVRRRKRAQASA